MERTSFAWGSIGPQLSAPSAPGACSVAVARDHLAGAACVRAVGALADGRQHRAAFVLDVVGVAADVHAGFERARRAPEVVATPPEAFPLTADAPAVALTDRRARILGVRLRRRWHEPRRRRPLVTRRRGRSPSPRARADAACALIENLPPARAQHQRRNRKPSHRRVPHAQSYGPPPPHPSPPGGAPPLASRGSPGCGLPGVIRLRRTTPQTAPVSRLRSKAPHPPSTRNGVRSARRSARSADSSPGGGSERSDEGDRRSPT